MHRRQLDDATRAVEEHRKQLQSAEARYEEAQRRNVEHIANLQKHTPHPGVFRLFLSDSAL